MKIRFIFLTIAVVFWLGDSADGFEYINFKQLEGAFAFLHRDVHSSPNGPLRRTLIRLQSQTNSKAVFKIDATKLSVLKIEFDPERYSFMEDDFNTNARICKYLIKDRNIKASNIPGQCLAGLRKDGYYRKIDIAKDLKDIPYLSNGHGFAFVASTHTLAELRDGIGGKLSDNDLLRVWMNIIGAVEWIFESDRVIYDISPETIGVNRETPRKFIAVHEHTFTSDFERIDDKIVPSKQVGLNDHGFSKALAFGSTPTFTKHGLYQGEHSVARAWWQVMFTFMSSYQPLPWKTWIIDRCLDSDGDWIGVHEIWRLWRTYVMNGDATELVKCLDLEDHPHLFQTILDMMPYIENGNSSRMSSLCKSTSAYIGKSGLAAGRVNLNYFNNAFFKSINFK